MTLQRQLVEKRAIDVGVRHWDVLHQIASVRAYGDVGSRASYLKCRRQVDRNSRPYVNILAADLEVSCADGQVIVVIRYVIELVFALIVGGDAAYIV